MMRTIKRSLTRSQYFRLFAVLIAACIIPACHRDGRTPHDAPPTANDDAVVTVEGVAIAILLTGTDMTFALGATAPANGALSGFDPATGAVTYTPDPGFIGDDTFTFTVTDGTNTSSEATVTVTVLGNVPPTIAEITLGALDQLQALIDAATNPNAIPELQDAFDATSDALDLLTQNPPNLDAALGRLQDAAGVLENAVANGRVDAADVQSIFEALIDVARPIASDAIDNAIANGGDGDEIIEALENLDRGDAEASAGSYGDAIGDYRQALDDALESLD